MGLIISTGSAVLANKAELPIRFGAILLKKKKKKNRKEI